MKPHRAFFVACLATCALLLAACGGSGGDKDEYEAGLKRMQSQLADANAASRESGATTDVVARRAALGTAYESLDEAAKTAAGLDPPEDAERANSRLVSALRDYADLFERLAELPEDDPSESELYSEAGEIVDRLDSANRALDKAGYSVDEGSDEE